VKDKPLASIDIGTNTFRLLIAEVHFNSSDNSYTINEVYSERVITRLGDGVSESGLLSETAIRKSIDTLKRFSDLIAHHDVFKTSSVATSALREAGNSEEFLNLAKEVSGLDINVITGEDEAKITAAGMLMDFNITKPALLLDIGGGSTELISTRPSDSSHLKVHSMPLGVVYLANNYMKQDPPTTSTLESLENNIYQQISKTEAIFSRLVTQDTVLIGTAGTVTAIASISQGLTDFAHDKIHKCTLTIDKVRSIYADISAMSSEKRAKLIPFDLARLDIIVPGTLILLKLMETFGFLALTVSNYGLREGILIQMYNESINRPA